MSVLPVSPTQIPQEEICMTSSPSTSIEGTPSPQTSETSTIPRPTLRRQVSTLRYLNSYYGNVFFRMAHNPKAQQKASGLSVAFNTSLIVASTISLVFLSKIDEIDWVAVAYIATMAVRSVILLMIHTHCLLVPDMYINRHSSAFPATLAHKLQRALAITVRVVSILILLAGMFYLFAKMEDLSIANRSMLLAWVGLDVVIVLGELAIYIVVIRVVSWRVVSVLAPYVPISRQSMAFFQHEEQRSLIQAKKRAGFDKQQLKALKQSEQVFHQDASIINTECAICLLDFETNEVINTLRCHHTYHSECITEWLRHRGTCPLCVSRAEPLVISTTKSTNSKSSHSSVSRTSSSSDVELSITIE